MIVLILNNDAFTYQLIIVDLCPEIVLYDFLMLRSLISEIEHNCSEFTTKIALYILTFRQTIEFATIRASLRRPIPRCLVPAVIELAFANGVVIL